MPEHVITIPLELAYECRDQLRRAATEQRTQRQKLSELGYIPVRRDRAPYSETIRRLADALGDDEPTPLPFSAHDTQPGMPAVTELPPPRSRKDSRRE